jgi:phenylalanyl-tRNA synthetase alpha chain
MEPRYCYEINAVAQGTAFSARKMTEGVNVPGRYFALARVYRPDVLDATHLNEFNQLEGFVVADEIAFKHLLGLLANFAKEIAGAEEIKFYPDYYPFTEPSVQISAKHPTLGWVELGGAGMFRPEFTESLGVKERCIAWGLGIDRLAMFNLGIKDIRELFSSRIEWLRDKPIVEKI